MNQFLSNILRILAVLIITACGTLITCGGNILLSDSDRFMSVLNSLFHSQKDTYIGNNVLFYWWFIEIGIIFFLSSYSVWRYDHIFSKYTKIFLIGMIGIILFLLFFFLYL